MRTFSVLKSPAPWTTNPDDVHQAEFERHKVCPNFCLSNFQIYFLFLFLFFSSFERFTILSLFPRWIQEINPVGLGNVRSGMSARPGIRQTQQGVGHCSTNQRFVLSLMRHSVTWSHKVLTQLACLLHYVVMLWPFFVTAVVTLPF